MFVEATKYKTNKKVTVGDIKELQAESKKIKNTVKMFTNILDIAEKN